MPVERKQGQRTAPLVGLAALLAACGPEPATPVRVFAAASTAAALDDALQGLADAGGPQAVVVAGPSSALARQIAHGAPADLFVSADQAWMDHLEDAGLLQEESRVDLLGNTLVVVAPAGAPRSLDPTSAAAWDSAVGSGRLALADPHAVPAGRYAQAALSWAGAWPTLEDRLAPATDVRRALAFVAQEQAPLGVVYATDAAATRAVQVVATFPAEAHPAIVCPLAQTLRADGRPDADAVAAFLTGPDARAVFSQHGFGAP